MIFYLRINIILKCLVILIVVWFNLMCFKMSGFNYVFVCCILCIWILVNLLCFDCVLEWLLIVVESWLMCLIIVYFLYFLYIFL